MKTYKDIIFTVIIVVWVFSDIISYILGGLDAASASNIICMVIVSTIVYVKIMSRKFGLWLETNIKK